MNIFNERLQRMKFSYLMAVTQRDTAPAALFTLPLPGQPAAPAGLTPGFMPGPQRPGNASWPARPFSVPGQPTTSHAPPRVLHVRAHLLRAPATPGQPDWEPAAGPVFNPATFPISRPVAPQQTESWPALDANQTDASDPVFEAPTFDPGTLAQPTFAADPSVPTAGAPTDPLDPFGDLAEALAAGLTTAPPEQPQRSPLWTPHAPMAPTPASPEPEPVAAPPRMPSFTEAMALNGRLGAPTPTDRAVPTPAVLPTLPEQGPAVAARAAVPQAAPPASSPAQPFPPQSPQQPRVTLEDRLRAATAATEAPPALAAPVQAQPTIRPESVPQPNAGSRSAAEPIAEPVTAPPQSRPAPDDQGPPVQVSTPVAEVAPVEAASRPEPVPAPSNPTVIPEEPTGAMVEPSSEIVQSADDVEVTPHAPPEARAAEPATPTTELETSSAAAPEEDAAQQARQAEEEQKKRQELEDLMRRMNNGVPVRLPRRPRPNVPVKAEPTEPSPPPLPEIPLEVAQNFLARLNRFAEMEQSGDTSESPLLYNRLEHWEDHHPENNARIEDYLDVGTPDPPPTPAQAAPVDGRTAPSPSTPVRPTPSQPMTATNPPAGLPAAPAARLQKALEVGERHRLKAEPRTTVTSRAREGQPPSRPRTSPDADDTEGSTPAPALTRTLLSAAPVVAAPHQAREEQVQHTRPLLSAPDHETDDVVPLRPAARPAPVVENPSLASSSTAQSGIPALTDSAPEIQRERPTAEVSPHRMVSVASPLSPLTSEAEASTSMPAAQKRPVENPQVLPVESSVLPGLPLIPAVDGPLTVSTSVEAPARDVANLPAQEAGTPTPPALPTPEAAAVRQAREPILPAWSETVADQNPPRQVTTIPRGPQPIEGLPPVPTFLAPLGGEAAPVVLTRQTAPLISAAPVTPLLMADRSVPTRVTAMPPEFQPFEGQPAVSALLAPQGAETAPLVVNRQSTALSPALPVTHTSVQAWHPDPEPVPSAGDQVGQAPLFAAPVVTESPAHSAASLPVGLPAQRSGVLPDPINRGAEPSLPAGTSAWTRPAQPVFPSVQRPSEQSFAASRPDVDHAPAAIPGTEHPSDPATRSWQTSVVTPTLPMLGAPVPKATSPSFEPAAPVGLPPILPTVPSLTSPTASVWPSEASTSGFSAERPPAFSRSVLEPSPRTGTSTVSRPGLPSLPGLSALPGPALPVPVQPARPGLAQLSVQALQGDGHGTPLPLGVQDALQRTLGTSVRDIRVVRNAQVPALLSAANADGLAVDRTVFLPAHVDLTTPAGHALAAHEFTHVLRRTQPGFTPDVVRRANLTAPSLVHEEELAVLTEHLAHQEAHEAPRAPARTSSLPLTARERRGPRDMALPRAPVIPAPTRPEPAPVSPAAPVRTSAPAPQVHAADTNRPTPQPPTNPAPAPSKEREKDVAVGSRQSTTPQVDLDQVARDVYARLRERLGEELRRLRS